jgi:hypothetical protein
VPNEDPDLSQGDEEEKERGRSATVLV